MVRRTLLACVVLLATSVAAGDREITILYTNDIESVYEPVEAFWRPDMTRMGGMARLSSLIALQRAEHQPSLLLDAGDMFTGSLSKATEGKLVFDLYSAMGYDAGNLGNHEFEYGWRVLKRVMPRARFPLLNANIFYEGTDINFSQPYAILEAGDVRVGVIGLMGVDAFVNTMMISNRVGLEVKPPVAVVQALVDQIRPEVDMVVLLTHQNRTAPMQTDKEADPLVQRGYDEDYALAGVVRGVDLIVGGHSDHGLASPVIHPETGVHIVLTYGQGMHLGLARFRIESGQRPKLIEGRLIPVNADQLREDQKVAGLIEAARSHHPELTEVVGSLDVQAARQYYRESRIGNLLADMMRHHAGVDVGLMPAGAIRADLEAGDVTIEAIRNVFPFTDTMSVVKLDGAALKLVLEKGLSLEYGLSQFSGVTLSYDSRRPAHNRLIEASVGGKPIDDAQIYSLVTGSFTATGGENYTMFAGWPLDVTEKLVSDALIEELRRVGEVRVPPLGRQTDLADGNK